MVRRHSASQTPRGPGRLTAAETAELEGRLLNAAERTFIDKGYARATMEAIAKAAGASRKTVYARYANKAEVLTAVVNRLLDTALSPHREEIHKPPTNLEPRTLLLQIARELASLSEAPRVAGINRFVFAEALHSPDLTRLFLNLHARATDDVRTNLELLHEKGSLPRLPKSELAAVIFIEMAASIPRIRALLGAPLKRQEIEELTAVAVDIFLNGCGRS